MFTVYLFFFSLWPMLHGVKHAIEVLSILVMLVSLVLINKDTFLRNREVWWWLFCCFSVAAIATTAEMLYKNYIHSSWFKLFGESYYGEISEYGLLLLILLVLKRKFDRQFIKRRVSFFLAVVIMLLVATHPWVSNINFAKIFDKTKFDAYEAVFVGESGDFVRYYGQNVYFHRSDNYHKIAVVPNPVAITVSADGTKVVMGHGYGNYNNQDEKQAYFKDDILFDMFNIVTGDLLPFKRDTPSFERFPAVHDAVFSREDKYLATLVGMASGPSTTIEIWDVSRGVLFRAFKITDQIKKENPNSPVVVDTLAFSPDGECLFLGGSGGIYAVDIYSGEISSIIRLDSTESVRKILFSPGGEVLYTIISKKGGESSIEIWDANNRQRITSLYGVMEKPDINGMSYARQAKRLAATGIGGDRIWDVANPASPELIYERKFQPPDDIYTKFGISTRSSISVSPDGKQVLTTRYYRDENTVVRWTVPE
ncbi:WD40 repeat domain-containing protein [Anaeroselena agilis]|uniref:WD40 repeat domain-containing protein n=1 Tax=Anaeroselena agilis TaxID=3063788 RepID=A0ABU3P2S9_9FIRM|nr:hypothetical protein [Selenomonadales bacterium 4137-cl]